MKRPLRCQCGLVQGKVDVRHSVRAVCYCKDCQASARFLGREAEILDRFGGTEIIRLELRYLVRFGDLGASDAIVVGRS